MIENEGVAEQANSVERVESEEKKGWVLLFIWSFIVITVNSYLSFLVVASEGDFKSIDILISYIVGNVLGFSIIVLVVSQIWKKFRNARSRVKAILYPSYLVLFAQGAAFFQVISKIAQQ